MPELTRRSHTAARAAYQPETLTVVDPESTSDLTRHYVMTRHGAVRRVYVAPGLTEVALWRPSLLRPQYQGTVARAAGGYRAANPNGEAITEAADYIDAEAALLPLRTRHRSRSSHGNWPAAHMDQLRWHRDGRPHHYCDTCGHPVKTAGRCQRQDLHW